MQHIGIFIDETFHLQADFLSQIQVNEVDNNSSIKVVHSLALLGGGQSLLSRLKD